MPPEVAGQQLEKRVRNQAAYCQQGAPAQTLLTQSDDHQCACQPACDKQPLHRRDGLLEHGDGQHGHQHGRDHDNGSELPDGHQLEPGYRHHRAGSQQSPTQQLQTGLADPKQRATVKRQQNQG